jgi:apolipoprotein D and lipocalin family protein
MLKKLAFLIPLILVGCVTIPEGVTPIGHFSLDRYLGKWYEIARLDHSFERELSRVTAEYSLRKDGGVRVLNRGISEKEKTWKMAEGKAYFVQSPQIGYLKVSFFGPFYGSYIILELDQKNYQYALVCGPNKNYLWLLSRSPNLPEDLIKTLLGKAAQLGFDTSKMIFVNQDPLPAP